MGCQTRLGTEHKSARNVHARSSLPDAFLKLLPLAAAVLVKLLKVLDALLGGTELGLLSFLGLQKVVEHFGPSQKRNLPSTHVSQELLCSDLDRGGCPVLDSMRKVSMVKGETRHMQHLGALPSCMLGTTADREYAEAGQNEEDCCCGRGRGRRRGLGPTGKRPCTERSV